MIQNQIIIQVVYDWLRKTLKKGGEKRTETEMTWWNAMQNQSTRHVVVWEMSMHGQVSVLKKNNRV